VRPENKARFPAHRGGFSAGHGGHRGTAHSAAEQKITPTDLRELYASHYAGQYFIEVIPKANPKAVFAGQHAGGKQQAAALRHRERRDHHVAARFDNLGKGASARRSNA
jgi:N-acetyl-gamma-glutamylphosphate reductase